MDKLVVNSDFAKAHVDTFTRKDGAVVQAHDTKVQAKAKPGKSPEASAAIYHEHKAKLEKLEDTHVAARPLGHAAAVKYSKLMMTKHKAAAAEHDPAIHDEPPHIGAHAKALRASSKPGDLDHEDNQHAADLMEAGDRKSLASHVQHLDTAARDHILDHMHPAHREKLGFQQINPERSLKKYGEKFPAPKPKAKPAAPAAPAAPQPGDVGHEEHQAYGVHFKPGDKVKDRYGKPHEVHSHVGPVVKTKGGESFHPTKLFRDGPMQKSILVLNADLLKAGLI